METSLPDFELKRSQIGGAGLGVFTKTTIPTNSYVALKPKGSTIGILRDKNDIPKKFLHFCIAKDNDQYLCPADFENIELVWYLNHSLSPNTEPGDDGYYALRDIKPGEEILIDYNSLDEPENKKEDFYKHR